jgi:hypothetical protein
MEVNWVFFKLLKYFAFEGQVFLKFGEVAFAGFLLEV